MTNIKPLVIGGKTLEDWDREWVQLDGGLRQPHPKLRYTVGLYRASLGGQIVVIGTGTDKGGGLAKRLSDFRRPSPSGRDYYAGERLHEDLDRPRVEVLITGHGLQAREIAQQLKTPMILRHKPSWNATNAPYMQKG